MTFNLEVEERRQEAALFQALEQHVEGDLDRQRINAAAIYDTGHHAITACLTGGPLACPRACLGDKIWNLTSHSYSPSKRGAASKGVGPRLKAARIGQARGFVKPKSGQ